MCHGHVASGGPKACGLFPRTGQCSSEPSPATNVTLPVHGFAPEHQLMHSNSLAKRRILPAMWVQSKWLHGVCTVMEKDTNSQRQIIFYVHVQTKVILILQLSFHQQIHDSTIQMMFHSAVLVLCNFWCDFTQDSRHTTKICSVASIAHSAE